MKTALNQKKLLEILQIFGERRLGFFYDNSAFTLCEYSVSSGEMIHLNGLLLQEMGLEAPEAISNYVNLFKEWPIAENLTESAKEYFTQLSKGYVCDNVNLCSLELMVKDKWMNVCAINTAKNGVSLLEILFMDESVKDKVNNCVKDSTNDELTNVPVLEDFKEIVNVALKESSSKGFLLVDFDDLTKINNLFGTETGDKALKDAIERLHNGLRSDDIIGRTDGDEFMICLHGIENTGDLLKVASHVLSMVKIDLPSNFSLTASIGAVLSPDGGTDFDTIYQNASVKLNEVKAKGGNDCFLFE